MASSLRLTGALSGVRDANDEEETTPRCGWQLQAVPATSAASQASQINRGYADRLSRLARNARSPRSAQGSGGIFPRAKTQRERRLLSPLTRFCRDDETFIFSVEYVS